MKHQTIAQALIIIAALSLLLGCGNSSSSVADTTRELAASNSTNGQAAVAGSAAASQQDSTEEDDVRRVERSVNNSERSSASSDENVTAPQASRRVAENDFGVRRLIVARGIEDREPLGAASRFESNNDRLYAFVEAVNEGDAGQLVVVFENEEGDEVGNINLEIPANVPRWRTWAWSQRVREPGRWTAVIRTSDGTELARERFIIEG